MMRDPEILRWWKRRYDLFERFDEGIQMDYGVITLFFLINRSFQNPGTV